MFYQQRSGALLQIGEMMKKIIIACALLTIFLTSAFAEEVNSGHYIQSNVCNGNGGAPGCALFVSGVLGGIDAQEMASDSKKFFCNPGTVTIGHAKSIFIKYMAERPDQLQHNAAVLVYFSLMKAFPCPGNFQ